MRKIILATIAVTYLVFGSVNISAYADSSATDAVIAMIDRTGKRAAEIGAISNRKCAPIENFVEREDCRMAFVDVQLVLFRTVERMVKATLVAMAGDKDKLSPLVQEIQDGLDEAANKLSVIYAKYGD